MENPKPWAEHCAVVRQRTGECPGELLARAVANLAGQVERCSWWTPEVREPVAAAMNTAHGLVSISLVPALTSGSNGAAVRAQMAAPDMGSIPDGCDRCGREGDKLLRCSGCKVTRYCGAECQRAAWTDHMAICT
ncbi:hypothetical protein DFJ74DRAFT_682378 [Hyaloraphidium curvatum]|nr:hypothetical protein DFJ74DRAFT_682378 [Hyaloraphidium curvatum]